MVMEMMDTSYVERVEKNLNRKLNSVQSDVDPEQQEKESESENPAVDGEEFGCDEEQENDKDYSHKKRYKKKETVLVELPTDILNSPEVCSMLDRTDTTSRKAVGVISSILKTGKVDGKQVDLSQFKISRPTLERKRVHNRSVLMEQEIEDFSKKMPKYAAAHWDGKLIQDVTGCLQEHEAILVSGTPDYLVGKILSVSKLVNEDGNPTRQLLFWPS